jgi:hypothetical protein
MMTVLQRTPSGRVGVGPPGYEEPEGFSDMLSMQSAQNHKVRLKPDATNGF